MIWEYEMTVQEPYLHGGFEAVFLHGIAAHPDLQQFEKTRSYADPPSFAGS